MLDVLEYSNKEKKSVLFVIPLTRQLTILSKDYLLDKGVSLVVAAKIFSMKEWYRELVARGRPNTEDIKLEFTVEAFENFNLKRTNEDVVVQESPSVGAPVTKSLKSSSSWDDAFKQVGC